MVKRQQEVNIPKEIDPLDPEFWSREWQKASKASSLSRKNVNDEEWIEFWSHISHSYRSRMEYESKMVDEIIPLFLSEGLLTQESVVLDIGCGPGTFSIPLAQIAARVVALDPAGRMLDTLMDETRRQNISNITPLCQKWEEACFKREFDLVLASFSPAIRDSESLLRMHQASRKYCCLITSSDGENFRVRNELWKLVLGEPFHSSAFHIIYPFNYLYSCGFRPQIRFLKSSVCYEEPVDILIDWYENYFKLFIELKDVQREIIRQYFDKLAIDGVVKTQVDRKFAIMWWGVEP